MDKILKILVLDGGRAGYDLDLEDSDSGFGNAAEDDGRIVVTLALKKDIRDHYNTQ